MVRDESERSRGAMCAQAPQLAIAVRFKAMQGSFVEDPT